MKDITFGSYYRAESVIHRLDARVKILLLIGAMVAIFTAKGTVSLATVAVFSFTCMLMTNVPFRLYLKSMKPLLILVIFTSLLNIFYTPGEIHLFDWWIFHPTFEGLLFSLKMITRITSLIILITDTYCMRHIVARTGSLHCRCGQEEHRHGSWKHNRLQHIQHNLYTWHQFSGHAAHLIGHHPCRLLSDDCSGRTPLDYWVKRKNWPFERILNDSMFHILQLVSYNKSNILIYGNSTDFYTFGSIGNVPLRNEPHEFGTAESVRKQT